MDRLLGLCQAVVVACALSGSAFSGLAAQVVRGEIVDDLNGRPVGGVLVVLLDRAGREHGRAVTDARGRFSLRGLGPGEYRLRTLIVGYRKWESQVFAVTSGQSLERRVELSLVRVQLPPITIEAERTCRVRPEEGLASAALWEEVKKALAATEWTIKQRLYRFRATTTERSLDRYLVVSAERQQEGVSYSYWPFGSLPAESLAAHGFVQDAPGGPIYYGPDAQVLVSDAFLDQHCFRIERGRGDESGLIGLAFQPVSGRKLPDIAGVLWVDSASTALRSLEYRYSNLPRWVPESRIGGLIEFARLPSGAWIIRRWRLRAPVPEIRFALGDTVLFGYKERTGEVAEVFSATGDLLIRYPPIR